ncbi:T6SS effector BTH_I2691 family protein [Halomonas sp. A29]|uniref:T6SS effector BTH_I2691 family protein n=1 Tax=Halomonas sp. A29 TaxID=3102786 RepID=UPI00398B0C8C
MTTPNPATANTSARSQGCAGVGAEDCRYCMRQGLPILPVRYAVCQVEENPDVPALPENRVSELYPQDADGNPIPIDLDTVIDEEGNAVAGKERKNQYILRKLRGGFLYVYDEGNDRWYAYAITETAELLQFRLGEPPEDPTPQTFACDQDSHRASATLVTLPNVASTRTAWFAYVEVPWSEAFWEEVASDSEWRERHMQRFDVDGWLNTGQAKYAFPQSDIATLVPEYLSSGQQAGGAGDTRALACTGSAAQSQLNQHCLPPRLGMSGRELEELLEAMDARVADNRDLEGKAGQGVMLAIKDEVGILEELNDYRHRPIEAMRIHQAADEQNARNAQWLASVNQLKAALEEAAQAQIREIDSDLADQIEAERRALAEETQQFEEHWKSKIDNEDNEHSRQRLQRIYAHEKSWAGTPDGLVGFDSLHDMADPSRVARYRDLMRRRSRRIYSVNKNLAKVLEELPEYYDQAKVAQIEEELEGLQKAIDTLVPRMDADYAQWLVHGLRDALDRYDYIVPQCSLRVTEIVSNALLGGVLSTNSEWAWQNLMEQLNSSHSPIVRAYFHNNREAAEAFVADSLELGEGKSFFGQIKLEEWFGRLKALREVANGGWGQSDFNAARQALSQLGDTILAAGAALLGQEAADQAAQGRPIAPRSGMMVRYARLLQVDSLVTTADATFDASASYVVEMEVSMGDYHRTIRYQANRDGSPQRNSNGEYQYVDHLENGERIGGNLPDPDVTDNTRVRMLWRIRNADLTNVAGYVEGVSPEGLSAGGEPVRIPMVHQQKLMADQHRQWGNMSRGDKAVQLLETVFALVSFYDVGKSVADKPKSLELWWGLLGAMAALTQIALGTAAIIEARRGLAVSGQLADVRAVRAGQYESAAKHLGRAVGVIGVIDGFRALAEAGAMARRGELSSRVRHQRYLGGIGILGGVIAVAASSLILVPLILGVMTLVIGYWLVRLVPRNIELWLRRSLYGMEPERLRFQPFANAQEEQQSLMMVFSGIEFDMEALRATRSPQDIRPAIDRPATDRQTWAEQLAAEGRRIVPDRYTLNLTATAGFPEELAGELTVLLSYHPAQGRELYLGGAKYANGDTVAVDRHGQISHTTTSTPFGTSATSGVASDRFELVQEGERKVMLFDADLEAEGGRLEAIVLYYTEANGTQRGVYNMELIR